MFLLNHAINILKIVRILFTFHYVSIKSKQTQAGIDYKQNLHSTMFLLNREVTEDITPKTITQFTFHYVSIKSKSD